MKRSQSFNLIYAPQVKAHLKAIERKYHGLIRQTIETQLRFEPAVETKNRKPLKQPIEFGAEWEIRFGPHNRFRVFYEINDSKREVYIIAIGIKQGNRLLISGEEVES